MKYLKITFLLILLAFTFTIIADAVVKSNAEQLVYDNPDFIPHNKVGLILGTGKTLSNGRLNLYYKYRIEAAIKLYEAGKIEYILASGDNSREDYDEPTAIKNDLIAAGIPAEKIYLDYAGFRTLDSVVRSKEIFGQHSITIISQQFHTERAIYLAMNNGINSIGFNAQDVHFNYGLKTNLREKLARVKMMLDLATGKAPKFLGEPIEIG